MASDKDILADAKEAFELCADAEQENRNDALDDLKFARLGEQWPDKVRQQRVLDGRPILTINRMPAFIRQIVNDSRQNKPSIKVKPVDDKADKETAEILAGLIRNIEYVSKADVAYDTAVDFAVSCGFGYFRIAIDYEYDDSFDKGLRIKRIANPFSVYGDPHSTEADSSDWNMAFVTEYMKKADFEAKYKGAQQANWEGSGYDELDGVWANDDGILTAEYWTREKVQKTILLLSNGQIVGEEQFAAGQDLFMAMGIQPVNSRQTSSWAVTQRIMTGAEILETNKWAGIYIPIVPVYGEEVNVEGKRYYRSMIRDAKDAQRMFNYWRTTATELVALAPRVPWIGEEGTFDVDPNWLTANTTSHAYLQYAKGSTPPQRLQLDSGPAAGAMQESLMASDDMKSIMGMFDASLGAKSNETSGRAIMARQREGDVGSFHFIDNLSRAMRHEGCILLDLIPKVYSGQRMVRVLGEDGKETVAQVGSQDQGEGVGADGSPQHEMAEAARVYDLSLGKYDIAVDTGPGFTTRREETAAQMTEFVRAYPDAIPVIGDLLVKSLDWQHADEIADRLKAMNPALKQGEGGMPPEAQQMMQEGMQQIQQLQAENEQLKQKAEIEAQKLQIEAFKAQTERLQVQQPQTLQVSEQLTPVLAQTVASTVSPMLADTIAQVASEAASNAVAQILPQVMASLPPTRVAMPKIKRTPVRDKNGIILHTIDEPIEEESDNPMVN